VKAEAKARMEDPTATDTVVAPYEPAEAEPEPLLDDPTAAPRRSERGA